MKKLYVTFVTGLIISCVCLAMSVIAGIPFSGTPKTNVAKAETVATVDAADATYTFSVTTPSSSSPVVIGPNRQVDLQDGESIVMQFTIVSYTCSYHGDGIIVSKRDGIPTNDPFSSAGTVGWYHNGGAGAIVGTAADTAKKDITGNGATIFAAGNTVRATFTPKQSDTQLGLFLIEYKTQNSNTWVTGTKISSINETVGRNAQIWMIFSKDAQGSPSLTLKDYTITTTYGANLLDSEDGREDENANSGSGLWIYDTIGLAYVHGTSTYTAKAYTEAVYKITYGGTAGLYPSKAASISDGGSAILEFSLSEANIAWSGNFGFTLDRVYGATNGAIYASEGVWLYSQSGSNFNKAGKFSTNVTFDTTYNCGSHDIMKAGNSVKVVYTPAYGTDCDGVFEIYTKTTTDTDYQLKVKATGLGSDIKSSVYISIFTNNSSNNYTLKTYKYYTVDSKGNETVYHDNNIESLKFASSSSNTITNICNDVNVSVKENAMNFTGTEKDYTVYVKDGGSYKLPAYTTAEKEIFLGYAIDGKLYKAGDVYTPTANVTVTALSIRNFENLGASIRVGGFMGIRFENTYNTADYTAASAYITELGTLIARVVDITDSAKLTTSTNENVKKIVSTHTFAEKDGVTTYAGGISNLKIDNYGKDLAGCGYITVTYADNTTATFYTNILVRSAKSVAEIAIEDQTEGSIEYTILSAYINGEAYPSDTEVE